MTQSPTKDIKEDVQQTASTAAEKSQEVAGHAVEQAQQVASTAGQQAREVGHEAKVQAQRVVEDAKAKLRDQGESQSHQLAASMRDWSDRAQALADGRPEDAGPLGQYVQQAAGKVGEVADRFEQRGIEGTLDDMRGFARRRPGLFLAVAGLAGFAVGRMVRGAAAEHQQQASEPQAITSYGAYQPVERELETSAGSYDPAARTQPVAVPAQSPEGSGNGY